MFVCCVIFTALLLPLQANVKYVSICEHWLEYEYGYKLNVLFHRLFCSVNVMIPTFAGNSSEVPRIVRQIIISFFCINMTLPLQMLNK